MSSPDPDPFEDALDHIKTRPAKRGDVWRAFFEQFLFNALKGERKRTAPTDDTGPPTRKVAER